LTSQSGRDAVEFIRILVYTALGKYFYPYSLRNEVSAQALLWEAMVFIKPGTC